MSDIYLSINDGICSTPTFFWLVIINKYLFFILVAAVKIQLSYFNVKLYFTGTDNLNLHTTGLQIALKLHD
jgi:hypothetical protein